MQPLVRSNVRWLRPAFAGLMAAIVLGLSVFASSERLHAALHQDPGAAHHLPCAICSFAHGQLELPAPALFDVPAALSVSWTLPAFQSALTHPADFSVASSRGPPASVSSLL